MSKQPEIVEVQITNWDKYHTDKKGKQVNTSVFFRLQKDMVFDPKIQQLNASDFRLFITMMALSKRGKVVVMGSVLSTLVNNRHQSLSSMISKLLKLGLIEPLDKKERIDIYSGPPSEKSEEDQESPAPRKKKNSTRKFKHPENFEDFLEVFPKEVMKGWDDLYLGEREWIVREMKKAFNYFYVERQKAPSASVSGWTRRMSGWLQRGWEGRKK